MASAGTDPAVLGEAPSPTEAFLEHFPSLNSFSAAALASVDLPLRELISLSEEQQAQLCALLPGVPARSLRLFWQHASYGTPTLAGADLMSSTYCSLVEPALCTMLLPCLIRQWQN